MRRRWSALLAAAALVAAFVALMSLGEEHRRPNDTPLSLDVRDAGRGGGRALWLLWGLQGHAVRRGTLDPAALRDLPTASVLFVAPYRDPVEEATGAALLDWARRGGTLVLVPFHAGDLPDALTLGLIEGMPGDAQSFVHPADARCPARTVAVSRQGDRLGGKGAANAILADARGAILVEVPCGAGTVRVLADASVVCNDALDRADNAVLGTWLLHGRDGSAVIAASTVPPAGILQRMLGDRWLRQVVAMLALLGLLFLANENVRTRRAVPLPRARERSQMEYVDAVAATYERAQAPTLALAAAYRWAAHRVGSQPRVTAQGGPGAHGETGTLRDALPFLRNRPGVDVAALTALCDGIEQDLATPRGSENPPAFLARMRALQHAVRALGR